MNTNPNPHTHAHENRLFQRDIVPNEDTYVSLINAAAVARNAELAEALYKEMTESKGITPTMLTFGALAKALRHASSLKPSLDLLKAMKEQVGDSTLSRALFLFSPFSVCCWVSL